MARQDILDKWINEVATLCQPQSIHYCNGTQQEYNDLCAGLENNGTFIHLNPSLRPNSFLARSNPNDVARVEAQTFICSNREEDAGPTNNWSEPKAMKLLLKKLFAGCMRGRTMYVIPFSMGPLDSPFSRLGVQLTDSPYVVCSMRLIARIGSDVWERLKEKSFVPCLHSVGMPLVDGKPDVPWPCNSEKYIVHFPDTKEIWSFGSGYGGNALLGKKSFALRIASCMGREEGWLAEHMLILGLTNPEGRKKYIAAAFPSASGKTNLAMIKPTLSGWKVETVGDDIAWMKFGSDGQLYAINPEAGFFGVAPGTSMGSSPNAMATLTHNTLFTNVALTDQGDVWWEGMTKNPPEHLIDWQGEDWTPTKKTIAAQPNSRFTVSAAQCPTMDPEWENPQGVPISAIIFGGRRASVVPLVREAFDWEHGVFFGSMVSSETTAAATGKINQLRHDPFSMLPFCGYHMGDYFSHWLSLGKSIATSHLPKFYFVNWFQKGGDNAFLWPGFGENSRVLKWIFERCEGLSDAIETPIGFLPKEDSLDLAGLSIDPSILQKLLHVNADEWVVETDELKRYYTLFGEKLPHELQDQLSKLQSALDVRPHPSP